MKVLQMMCSRRFWALALIIGTPFLCSYAGADSTGPHAPTLVVSGVPTTPWTSPESAIVSDDIYASLATSSTNTILASGFGFSVPFGSTINGVVVTVERHSASGSPPAIPGGDLIKPDGSGSSFGVGAFDTDAWATTDIVSTMGAPDYLWQIDLTPADVNDPAFTVLYGMFVTSADTFFIDAITAEVFFDPPVLLEPCDTIARAIKDYAAFSNSFGGGTSDLDADGLPESAVLALMQAVACNALAAASLDAALFNAYNINLILLESEGDLSLLESEATAAGVQNIRSLIAFLAAGSATLEAAVKDALAMYDPAITLTGDYVAVTCSGTDCVPSTVDGRSIREEYEVFSRASRATNEPFSATGDLDGDGTDNVTEYDNVTAQGGETSDFVIAATSPTLDGTDPIRTPGGPNGGCFIATAAYGTPLAGEIDALRALRDRFLLRGALGTAFVDTYYRASPPIARGVAAHPALASVVRYALAAVLLVAGLGLTPLSLAACTAVALLLVATYRVRRRRRVRVR